MTEHRPKPVPQQQASETSGRDYRQRLVTQDEALPGLGKEREQAPPRPHVLTAYRESRDKFDELYKKLAE